MGLVLGYLVILLVATLGLIISLYLGGRYLKAEKAGFGLALGIGLLLSVLGFVTLLSIEESYHRLGLIGRSGGWAISGLISLIIVKKSYRLSLSRAVLQWLIGFGGAAAAGMIVIWVFYNLAA